MIVTERNTGEEKILIRGADTDRFNDASIPFFFSICQDAGGFHAGLFGFSAEELMGKHNWTWMILRSRIRFHKIPHLGDTIKVETWAQPSFHLFFPRVINGYTDNGEPVFEAMTHWVLFDIARKRPLRPSTLEFPLSDESIRKDPELGKMPDWDDVKKLEILPSYAPECSYYDVDLNKHINNVVYIRWVLSSLPDEFLETHVIDEMDVAWLSQTFEDNHVSVESAFVEKGEKTRIIHRVLKEKEDGSMKECFEAFSVWKEKI